MSAANTDTVLHHLTKAEDMLVRGDHAEALSIITQTKQQLALTMEQVRDAVSLPPMQDASEASEKDDIETSPAGRIDELRDKLLGAQAIVEVVKESIDPDRDYCRWRALSEAYESLESIATEMECVCNDLMEDAT